MAASSPRRNRGDGAISVSAKNFSGPTSSSLTDYAVQLSSGGCTGAAVGLAVASPAGHTCWLARLAPGFNYLFGSRYCAATWAVVMFRPVYNSLGRSTTRVYPRITIIFEGQNLGRKASYQDAVVKLGKVLLCANLLAPCCSCAPILLPLCAREVEESHTSLIPLCARSIACKLSN